MTNFSKRFSGTTSACAENTWRPPQYGIRPRNYLRVRGEYTRHGTPLRSVPELPPRARRIQITISPSCAVSGTTSACAENTLHVDDDYEGVMNYLRVRGEYCSTVASVWSSGELPPRARRIHTFHYTHPTARGTTSACAENTWRCTTRGLITRNYLRVRGEYSSPQPQAFSC